MVEDTRRGVCGVRPSDDVVLTVRNIGKMYRLYDRPQDRLKHQLLGRFGRSYGREFWALRETSFEVRRGEVLGIIGCNGSGKSTLLQILAGVLTPTTGEAHVNGRVAALLELGSGFNLEYTGRDNIFMNGAILDIPRAEMDKRFEEIVAFADIGSFIDQPVKTYSSGMFVRLAFAVTISMDADVLLIDEALAVGDVFFRQKCYQRLERLRQRGIALVLVSHAMPEVEQFCQRALVLQHGEMLFHGAAPEAVKRYYLLEQHDRIMTPAGSLQPESTDQTTPTPESAHDVWPSSEACLDISAVPQVANGWARCTRVALCNSQGQPCRVFQQGEMASFFYEFELLHEIEVPIGGVVIQNDKGVLVHGKNTLEYGADVPMRVTQQRRLRFRQDIALEVAVGEYTFEVGLATLSRSDYESRGLYTYATLSANILRLCHLPAVGQFAVTFRHCGTPVQLLHHGMANLPGQCYVRMVSPAGAALSSTPQVDATERRRRSQQRLTPNEVMAGYRVLGQLYPYIPPMVIWRAWEYAAYRRYALTEPVLDIGCGDGHFFRLLWPNVRDVVGIDIDPDVVVAAQQSEIYREVHAAPAHALPFASERFASIFANCSLEHMDHLAEVLAEISRCLRPGGTFLLSVVTEKFTEWTTLPLLLRNVGESDRAAALQADYIAYHHLVNPLTPGAWTEHLVAAGMHVEDHVPLLPELTGRLFLLLDHLWHIRCAAGEVGDRLPELFASWSDFQGGLEELMYGLLRLEPNWDVGCGAIFYARKHA